MQFSSIAGILERRLLVVFLAIASLVVGVPSFKELPLQAYPGMASLSMQAITRWPGRGTTEVEQQIIVPIENALAGMSDIQSFRPVSLFGLLVVALKLKEGTDSFKARQSFSQYLADVGLPTGVQSSLSPDSSVTGEIMRLCLEGNSIDLATLKSYQDYDISKELKRVQGIADVSSFGDKVKEYHIAPSPAKLLSYGTTLSRLIMTIDNANNNMGGNLLYDGGQQSAVRGVDLLQTIGDIRGVVVTANSGVPIRVCDIAEVEVGSMQHLSQVQYNDQPSVVEGTVLLRRDTDATEVPAKVREEVTKLNNGILPKSVQIKPFYDHQVLLDITMGTVEHTLVVGITLMLTMLFIFLDNFRAAAMAVTATLLALCISFISTEHFHVLASPISPGAIGLGMIADTAVIVVENIIRYLEESVEKLENVIVRATNEVQHAIILSMGIITVAHPPLFFIGGVEGIIFRPMAFTMGFALTASIVLSLTFVSVIMSFVFGKTLHSHSPVFIAAILRWYKPLLRKLTARPMTAFAMAITAPLLTLYSVTFLDTEFPPMLEENNLWLCTTLPNTVDLEYSMSVVNNLCTHFVRQPEIQKVPIQIRRPNGGTDSTSVFSQGYGFYFAPPDQWARGMTKERLVKHLSKHLEKTSGIEYNFSQYIQDNVDEALSGIKGENSVKLFGNDLSVPRAKANEIQAQLKEVQGLVDMGILRELGQPTLNVSTNRQAAARFNINVSDMQNLVQYTIGGIPVTQILGGEKSFGLTVWLNQQARASYDAIRELLIDTLDEQRIPPSMITKVEMTDGPFFIYRGEGKRYITIKFGVRGRDPGGAVDETQRVVDNSVKLPEGYTVKWGGQFNEMRVVQGKLMVIMPLTVLVILLLLYSMFGNFKDVLMMALNTPFAIIGRSLVLHIANETLLILTGIGFLSLFGVAIQDGVILISYVNRLSQSENVREVIVDDAALHLRPVTITAMLAGLGFSSAASSHSIGSEAQRPLVLAIIDGMVAATILTLLVLSMVFAWVHCHCRPPPRDLDANLTAAMLP